MISFFLDYYPFCVVINTSWEGRDSYYWWRNCTIYLNGVCRFVKCIHEDFVLIIPTSSIRNDDRSIVYHHHDTQDNVLSLSLFLLLLFILIVKTSDVLTEFFTFWVVNWFMMTFRILRPFTLLLFTESIWPFLVNERKGVTLTKYVIKRVIYFFQRLCFIL